MSAAWRKLAKEVERVVESAPGRWGVAIRLVGHGQIVGIDSDRPFPLASVYKVPILATVFRKVHRGEISLDARITLREADKSLGGDLGYFRPGIKLTVHDLCCLMIVRTDNTAADMLHHFIGMSAPNAYMHELGLRSIDIKVPSREYFLIFIGWASRFRGMSLQAIAEAWKKMSREEIASVLAEVRKETRGRSVEDARKLGRELWGIAGEKETKVLRDATVAMDNYASAADIAKLHELIVTKKIAPSSLTDQMLDYMLRCDSRDGIPRKIPETVLVANKTGGGPAIANDSAIIFASPKSIITCACLCSGAKHSEDKAARAAIAEIGRKIYTAFKT
jgi:beta-lactamase class A